MTGLFPHLSGKSITLAVTGGIAAYKACELVRLLVKSGASVRVCMTQAATRFVGPLTFEALSGRSVVTEAFEGAMQHLALTRNCDLLIVAPATANILAKAANGIADDLVSSVIAASAAPVAFCPAMNTLMWSRSATQRNVRQLATDGFEVWGPASGSLACGVEGAGRMIEPVEIAARASRLVSPHPLAGRRVVVTAGPTYEAIDPVRGITNRSSGLQGYAVAQAAFEAGANVTLITGPTALAVPFGVESQHVLSAVEMRDAVIAALPEADIFISVAAVADWRSAEPAANKIKKRDGVLPALQLVENPDILAEAVARFPGLYCAGFAAETENVVKNAKAKLTGKAVHLIVGNDAARTIGSDMNEAYLVSPRGVEATGALTKQALADRIIAFIANDLSKGGLSREPQHIG